jgi:ANTAR domain-containing protein/GAF domain-containing protein
MMADLEAFGSRLAAIIAAGGDSAPLLICAACADDLPVDGAAITLMLDVDRQEPICATDDIARHLVEVQFSLGEGPSLEAFETGRMVMVPDLSVPDQRWPMFAGDVQCTSARAMHVLPLQLGAIRLGVLDLYSRTPGAMQVGYLLSAYRAADAAFWTLLGRRNGKEATSAPPPWMTDHPLHRAEVHQATGMIVVQAGVRAEEALAMLRAFAFANNRLIDEVARAVVARKVRFAPEPR